MHPLEAIGHNIRTQDNLATALPMFVVQSRLRIYGMDRGYSDNVVWVDAQEGTEATKAQHRRLEQRYEKTRDDEHNDWRRTRYIDHWEWVTVCFTKAGAEDYIRVNGHNLTTPRIYVASGYRNAEWELVRAHLMAFMSKEQVS